MNNNLSLRKWLRQPATDGELRAVFREIGLEQSPRAAALGAAVMVEVGLSSMLRARLWIKDDSADNELFGSNGPISTFSQKIKMAEAMRIIGPDTRSNLDYIREIRNAFAHTHRDITFDTFGVTSLCERIKFTVWPRRQRMPHIATPRDRYVYASLGLFVVLEEMAKHTRSQDSGDYSNYRIQSWWGERYPAPLP
jgi:hypothetical protein